MDERPVFVKSSLYVWLTDTLSIGGDMTQLVHLLTPINNRQLFHQSDNYCHRSAILLNPVFAFYALGL